MQAGRMPGGIPAVKLFVGEQEATRVAHAVRGTRDAAAEHRLECGFGTMDHGTSTGAMETMPFGSTVVDRQRNMNFDGHALWSRVAADERADTGDEVQAVYDGSVAVIAVVMVQTFDRSCRRTNSNSSP